MRITVISDLHGELPTLTGGDLLLICGDMTACDTPLQWEAFFAWLNIQQYDCKVFIAGNHDRFLEQVCNTEQGNLILAAAHEDLITNYVYLKDNFCMYNGLKIYGTPWTKSFDGMNRDCMAFTKRSEMDLKEIYSHIPEDTDILLTHGPAFGTLDTCSNTFRAGSHTLADRLLQLPHLKLHCFGHIHEGYGQCHQYYNTVGDVRDFEAVGQGYLSINCSIMDGCYEPVNKPVDIEL